MPSKEEMTRNRVVTFYNNNTDKPISYTVKHFMAEGMPRSSIYNIINTYKKRLTTKEKVGKGRYFQKMSTSKVQKLYRMMNHKDNFTISGAARKFSVDRRTIKYWLKKRSIRRYKKKKSPKYNRTQEIMVKRQCAWLCRYCRKFDFVIDDEKHFTLSHSLNDSYFASPKKSTPDSVKYAPKQKFEPKVMLWIAISKNGMSKPFLQKSGLAINQNVYSTFQNCVPFQLLILKLNASYL
jgi:hypothetical protein